MISVKDKEKCCGCEACVQICPQRCITFDEDSEGFRYPRVDTAKCVQCGLCTQVCPMLNSPKEMSSLQAFSYQSAAPKILSKSSSGGLFSALASHMLSQGGVVAGARFNERWEVEHTCVDTLDELEDLRTSKYVQSRVGHTFKEVAETLSKGRPVLFCGTPCQVAALRRFVRRNQELLTCADFICHGVPSPLVWRQWLSSTFKDSKITEINFRSKSKGWRNYHLEVRMESGDVFSFAIPDSAYTRAFSANITLRPSCYRCPMRGDHRSSDLTMADFWGLDHLMDSMQNDQGVSLAFARTEKVMKLLEDLGAVPLNYPMTELLRKNSSYAHQTPTTALRHELFSYAVKHPDTIIERLEQLTHLSPMQRRYYKICTFVRKIFGMI